MTWAKAAELFEELQKQGKKLGPGAQAKPQLLPRLEVYWQAFLDLHRRRQWHASGPQPLTYQEMKAYIELKFPMGKAQILRFLLFVEQLDDVYLSDYADKQEKKG